MCHISCTGFGYISLESVKYPNHHIAVQQNGHPKAPVASAMGDDEKFCVVPLYPVSDVCYSSCEIKGVKVNNSIVIIFAITFYWHTHHCSQATTFDFTTFHLRF